jgi:hypothetical protein
VWEWGTARNGGIVGSGMSGRAICGEFFLYRERVRTDGRPRPIIIDVIIHCFPISSLSCFCSFSIFVLTGSVHTRYTISCHIKNMFQQIHHPSCTSRLACIHALVAKRIVRTNTLRACDRS